MIASKIALREYIFPLGYYVDYPGCPPCYKPQNTSHKHCGSTAAALASPTAPVRVRSLYMLTMGSEPRPRGINDVNEIVRTFSGGLSLCSCIMILVPRLKRSWCVTSI